MHDRVPLADTLMLPTPAAEFSTMLAPTAVALRLPSATPVAALAVEPAPANAPVTVPENENVWGHKGRHAGAGGKPGLSETEPCTAPPPASAPCADAGAANISPAADAAARTLISRKALIPFCLLGPVGVVCSWFPTPPVGHAGDQPAPNRATNGGD